jgi:hypothetical protein
MVVDCLGKEPKRELSGDVFKASQVLLVSCPWNFAQERHANVTTMLNAFRGMLRWCDRRHRKVFFFCKKGERRSAAVLMVVLCEVFGFSRRGAKCQIEDMRSVAKITTESERGYEPSWNEVNRLLDELREY